MRRSRDHVDTDVARHREPSPGRPPESAGRELGQASHGRPRPAAAGEGSGSSSGIHPRWAGRASRVAEAKPVMKTLIQLLGTVFSASAAPGNAVPGPGLGHRAPRPRGTDGDCGRLLATGRRAERVTVLTDAVVDRLVIARGRVTDVRLRTGRTRSASTRWCCPRARSAARRSCCSPDRPRQRAAPCRGGRRRRPSRFGRNLATRRSGLMLQPDEGRGTGG